MKALESYKKTAARGKPKCIKGTACGYSCISGKYTCTDKILKRDADALLSRAGLRKASAVDSQKPPLDLSLPNAVEQYVRAWQKDRGFANDKSTTLDVHDIDHAIAYKSSGLSPAEISDKFGSPSRKYDGKPTFAEEAFVLMHAVSALPGVTKQQTLDYIQLHYSTAVRKGIAGEAAFPGGEAERKHYADEAAMLARFNEMYEYVEAASEEDRDLSRRNAVRSMLAGSSAITGRLKIESIDEDLEVDNVFEFAESGFDLLGLAKMLLSVDNCGSKAKRKSSFKEYVLAASELL